MATDARQEYIKFRTTLMKRVADTWPEAIRKQEALMSEVWMETKKAYPDADEQTDKFAQGACAAARAQELWHTVGKDFQPQIDALQRQIEALHKQWRVKVADQLAAESDNEGWQWVVSDLRERDDPADMLEW